MQTQIKPPLAPEQIEQFHQDGFLVVENLLDSGLAEQLSNRFDALFAGTFDTGVYPDEWHWNPYLGKPGASGQMTGVWKCDRALAAVITSARIGQIAAALEGWSGARLLGDDIWQKPPGALETTLHQDAMYFTYHTPPACVVGWVALSHAIPGGSTIEYVRGSHRWPLSTTVPEFHGPSKSYRWEMEQAAAQAGVAEPEVVQLRLEPGSCAFHNGRMWHGSGKNCLPDLVRRSLVLSYISAEAQFKPFASYVPGGYIAGKYKRYGDDTMDESFFPIVWREDGYRTPFLDSYCESDGDVGE
ncbi:MAG: phytanoyl-CoA dioxygenase family protein [Cyanobacteria bacterium P01_H01_bin.58]